MRLINLSSAVCFTLGLVVSSQGSAQASDVAKASGPESKAPASVLPSVKGATLATVIGPPLDRFPDVALGGIEAGQMMGDGYGASGMATEGGGADVRQRSVARWAKVPIPTASVPLGSFAIQDSLPQPCGIKGYKVEVPPHARAMGRLNVVHPSWYSIYLVNEYGVVEPGMTVSPSSSAKPAALATNDTDKPRFVYFVLDSRVMIAVGEPYVFEVVLGRLNPAK